MIASEAPQFSRGRLIGPGCCRIKGGGLRAWDEPSTAEAIAAKRVHEFPMNHTACAVHCAALKRCTHFELNMYDQPAHSNQGVCSVFASGGYSVTTACKDSSERPRMHCFAAAAYEHGLWHSPPLSLSEHALKDRRSVAVCVVGQPRSGIQTAPMIRRHVLDVLDADAFFVSQLKDGSEETKGLAIERLLGPRVRRAVHGTAQDLQPAGLVNQLEQVAEAPAPPPKPYIHTPFPAAAHRPRPPPLPPAGSCRTERARCYVEHEALWPGKSCLNGAKDCPTDWPRLRQPCKCM
jgi:hypothetical protein